MVGISYRRHEGLSLVDINLIAGGACSPLMNWQVLLLSNVSSGDTESTSSPKKFNSESTGSHLDEKRIGTD